MGNKVCCCLFLFISCLHTSSHNTHLQSGAYSTKKSWKKIFISQPSGIACVEALSKFLLQLSGYPSLIRMSYISAVNNKGVFILFLSLGELQRVICSQFLEENIHVPPLTKFLLNSLPAKKIEKNMVQIWMEWHNCFQRGIQCYITTIMIQP